MSRGYWWLATLVALLGFWVSADIFYSFYSDFRSDISRGELYLLLGATAEFVFQFSVAPAVVILLIGWAKRREFLRVSRGCWWLATLVAFLGFLVSTFGMLLLQAMQGPGSPRDLPPTDLSGTAEWVLLFNVAPVVLTLLIGIANYP